ncbi:MAG: copper homeostasis protein CutC, partial [Christensenellaceae bacterium]|nr:copper homeostasis protein CutC [Christensenellaceae bacterium]
MLEVCCASLKDAIICNNNNVKRIELNSSLELGGLTPFIEVIEAIKNNTKLEIIAMIRIRPGNFVYDEYEIAIMKTQANNIVKLCDGIAFGALNSDFTIDENTTKLFVDICHNNGKKFVFHRAFDIAGNIKNIEILIKLGVDRVLTSGLKANVELGMENLKKLQKEYGNNIEILAGGGVRPDNIAFIYKNTGI